MLSNESYFNGVYEQTYRPLLRYAVLKLSNPLDAEDALQNVYMRFFRRIAARGHADIADPGAFLHRLLRHDVMRRCNGVAVPEDDRAAVACDPQGWRRKCLVNIAKAGLFSSDRTIAEYDRDIWQLGK